MKKFFIIGLLFLFVPALSVSAEKFEGTGHRIVTFREGVKEALEESEIWKTCGNYFAGAETTEGKIIHFSFEKNAFSHASTFTFSPVRQTIVSINDKVATPMVMIISVGMEKKFILLMNGEDYRVALPCITVGTKV